MKYLLSSNEHVTGPYTKEELLDSLKYGVISPDSKISPQGSDEWVPIDTLFEAPEQKAQQQSPTALATVDEAPPASPFAELQQAQTNPATVYQQHYMARSSAVAVMLELIPGVFLQTFGIGNIYAGNVVTGIVLMISYWAFQIINVLLLFVLIGFVTLPLTFIAYLIISVITSQNAVEKYNWERIMQGQPRR